MSSRLFVGVSRAPRERRNLDSDNLASIKVYAGRSARPGSGGRIGRPRRPATAGSRKQNVGGYSVAMGVNNVGE